MMHLALLALALTLTVAERVADFDQLRAFVRDHGCFADAAAWERTCAALRPRAAAAPSDEAFVRVIEDALDRLHDLHSHLKANLPDSNRLPASERRAGGTRATLTLPDSAPRPRPSDRFITRESRHTWRRSGSPWFRSTTTPRSRSMSSVASTCAGGRSRPPSCRSRGAACIWPEIRRSPVAGTSGAVRHRGSTDVWNRPARCYSLVRCAPREGPAAGAPRV